MEISGLSLMCHIGTMRIIYIYYRDKDSEAGDKQMVSESSDSEDDTETASAD